MLLGAVVGSGVGAVVAVGRMGAVGGIEVAPLVGCAVLATACSFGMVAHALKLIMKSKRTLHSRAIFCGICTFLQYRADDQPYYAVFRSASQGLVAEDLIRSGPAFFSPAPGARGLALQSLPWVPPQI